MSHVDIQVTLDTVTFWLLSDYIIPVLSFVWALLSALSMARLYWSYFKWSAAANSLSFPLFSIINTLHLHWLRWTPLFFSVSSNPSHDCKRVWEALWTSKNNTLVWKREREREWMGWHQKPQLAHYFYLKFGDHIKWKEKVISFLSLSVFSKDASRAGS